MNPNDLTHAQIWTLLQQMSKRVASLETAVRQIVMKSDSWSGSLSSGGTTGTGGAFSVSGSYSADLESSVSLGAMLTSGTGSQSVSLPEGKQAKAQ